MGPTVYPRHPARGVTGRGRSHCTGNEAFARAGYVGSADPCTNGLRILHRVL